MAVRLFDRGDLGIADIAQRLGLKTMRVMRLLEQAHDRRELAEARVRPVATAVLKERFSAWRAQDPATHTFLELARLAGLDGSSTVQRLLGEIPTAPVVRGDVIYPGRLRTTVSVEAGGRLVRAMGYAPCEVPGL
jgi:hypothetical protein